MAQAGHTGYGRTGGRNLSPDAWHDRLAQEVATRSGLEILRLPNYPDSSEWREVASAAGADIGVRTSIRAEIGGWNIEIRMAGVRQSRFLPVIHGKAPSTRLEEFNIPRANREASFEPPPGLRTGVPTSPLDGPILDILSRRWRWSDVQVLLDDRIEAWRAVVNGLQPERVVDLSTI
ncbi:MAG: hypothetical protein FD129_3319, partial [bacterium]